MPSKKLKPTPANRRPCTVYARFVDAAKLDRLKAAACEVDDVLQKLDSVEMPQSLLPQFCVARRNFRAALLDGHAVEVVANRFEPFRDDEGGWHVHDNDEGDLIFVGDGTYAENGARFFAAKMNKLNCQVQGPGVNQ